MWSVKIILDTDITEALPYLNAELDGADYDHKAKVLIWKHDGKKLAFRPQEISLAPVQDREEVAYRCQEAVDLVNRIWTHRDDLEPDYSRKVTPNVMELYRKLPRTNCGKCGYPTCMAFAAALRDNQVEPEICPEVDPSDFV